MSSDEKDLQILALRYQQVVRKRQFGKPAFTNTDRAILAGPLHDLPMGKPRRSHPAAAPFCPSWANQGA
ncbi:hypothetical protein NMG29_35900 [Streptomyces cocklensis]|uniref:Uncharacterized protein n=1 Tax=Actinacidiphila cocklensis TaxID=887465 RepID=A0A9W4DUT5_9ACTN|nr:hypothetical protein [Actinacidiphila cocklensis]MDD1063490.1 hypothetical protein [Actinacidiphila cocklensis]CAG6398085.1 hypothetical protein SCOCK_630030 [Actinacidiphila cocklensis]